MPNQSAWLNLVKYTTSTKQQQFIKTNFYLPLNNHNRKIDFLQHMDFIKMMENFAFALILDTRLAKVSHGLG